MFLMLSWSITDFTNVTSIIYPSPQQDTRADGDDVVSIHSELSLPKNEFHYKGQMSKCMRGGFGKELRGLIMGSDREHGSKTR